MAVIRGRTTRSAAWRTRKVVPFGPAALSGWLVLMASSISCARRGGNPKGFGYWYPSRSSRFPSCVGGKKACLRDSALSSVLVAMLVELAFFKSGVKDGRRVILLFKCLLIVHSPLVVVVISLAWLFHLLRRQALFMCPFLLRSFLNLIQSFRLLVPLPLCSATLLHQTIALGVDARLCE